MQHNPLLGDANDFLRDNIGMAYDAVGNMAQQLKDYGIEYEDAVQEASMALCRAYEVYDGRFAISTLAYRCMYNRLRRMIFHATRKKRKTNLLYLDAPTSRSRQNADSRETELGVLIGDETDFSSVEVVEFMGKLSEDEQKAIALVSSGYRRKDAPMFGLRERQIKKSLESVAKRLEREFGKEFIPTSGEEPTPLQSAIAEILNAAYEVASDAETEELVTF